MVMENKDDQDKSSKHCGSNCGIICAFGYTVRPWIIAEITGLHEVLDEAYRDALRVRRNPLVFPVFLGFFIDVH